MGDARGTLANVGDRGLENIVDAKAKATWSKARGYVTIAGQFIKGKRIPAIFFIWSLTI